jgi:hypothetical protein
MRINKSKVCLVKSSFGGLCMPFDGPIFICKISLTKIYNFSRKSLSKDLMDTLDFNKHDLNIFINETWQNYAGDYSKLQDSFFARIAM